MEVTYPTWNEMANHDFRKEIIKKYKVVVVDQPKDVEIYIHSSYLGTFYELWDVVPEAGNCGEGVETVLDYKKAEAVYLIVPKGYAKLLKLKRFPVISNAPTL